MRAAAMIARLVIAAAFAFSAAGCGRAPADRGDRSVGLGAPVEGQAPAGSRAVDPIAARLGRMLDELHGAGRFDGAVVVSDRKGILFERGYGWADAERRVPFTPDTPTDGASLAKTFTAALLLSLKSDGILDLDVPARRWLPELPYPDVTLRHLLSHTSAIRARDYDDFAADLDPAAVRTTESLLGILAKRKPQLAGPPGRYFEYNSFGFDLAVLAAERAAGASYQDLLKARFFAPLGIDSAFVRPARLAAFPGTRTLAYRRDGGRLVPNDVFDGEGFYGGSNLYISARDLDRWNVAFLRHPNGHRAT